MTTEPTQVEVERLLSVWQSAHAARVSAGLEGRVLQRLEQAIAEGDNRSWLGRRPTLWGGWGLVAATASLLCIVTGGALVAREGSLAAHRAATALFQSEEANERAKAVAMHTPALAEAIKPARMAIAAARRSPATPVAAGHRRGRANATARLQVR